MPHFFINSKDIDQNKIFITDKENYIHIAKSLRAKPGETLLFIDENGIEYETRIADISPRTIETLIESYRKSDRFLEFDLYLAQSPLRSDAQSFLIEKATELGVKGVYPVLTDNCALNKSVISKKIEKWQRTMFEASKQCERANIPTCFDVTTLEQLLQKENFDRIIAFVERGTSKTLHDLFAHSPLTKGERVLVIIGPEGGFSQNEISFFEENDIPQLTLGKLILKAETAVTVALGNVIYEYENYSKN